MFSSPSLSTCGMILAATLVACPGPVKAQDDGDSKAGNEGGGSRSGIRLEEVVVTARRIEENLQDVPIAMSTRTGDELRREQINSLTDLNGKIPSLVVGTNSQTRNAESPTIRGQGSQFGASPGVVVYLGEVPLPADPIADFQGGEGKLFDLSNIQILKGSQGTLFGRNTTGGAMLLEPHRPENQLSASVRAGITSLEGSNGNSLWGQNYEAIFNVPIVDDTLLARVGGAIFNRDGFTQDVETGVDHDDEDYFVLRFGLLWQPLDTLENYLMLNYSDSDSNGTGTVIQRINVDGLQLAIPGACNQLNQLGPSVNCGQDILDAQVARGVRDVELSGDPNDSLESMTLLNKLFFELTDDLALVSISSYSTMDHSFRWDLDGSRAQFNEFINPEQAKNADVHTFTQELQVQGSAFDEALSYVIGGYYEDTDAEGVVIGKTLFFVDANSGYAQTKESIAGFAQGTYDLGHLYEPLSGLNLTLGVRYTKDDTSGHAFTEQIAFGEFRVGGDSFSAKFGDTATTWTAGLDYRLGDHLVYGKVSRGYKTGGIATISVNPANRTFDSEFVTNYELGHKSDFQVAGIPVRLNTAIFYTDYEDLQRGAPDSFVDLDDPGAAPLNGQSIFNAGEATVAGIELETTIRLTDRFTFSGTYAYTDADYDEFTIDFAGITPQLDCTGEAIPRGRLELSCVPFQTTPEHQFSLSGNYLVPIDESYGSLEASLTYAWTDGQYSSPTTVPEAEPGAWLPSAGLVNASLRWIGVFGTPLTAQLYGTNLTNEEFRVSNSNQWNLTFFQSSLYSEPRIIGFEVSYDWGM